MARTVGRIVAEGAGLGAIVGLVGLATLILAVVPDPLHDTTFLGDFSFFVAGLPFAIGFGAVLGVLIALLVALPLCWLPGSVVRWSGLPWVVLPLLVVGASSLAVWLAAYDGGEYPLVSAGTISAVAAALVLWRGPHLLRSLQQDRPAVSDPLPGAP